MAGDKSDRSVVNLDEARLALRRDEPFDEGHLNAVAECRECGKLIRILVQRYGDGFEVMSTGSPVFGACPSNDANPWCGDKFSARVFVVEEPGENESFSAVVVDPE